MKRAVLLVLFLLHAALGIAYGHYPLDDPNSDRVLLVYVLATHALLALWAFLDSRGTPKPDLHTFLIAIAVFGFMAMPFYLGFTRPAGSWPRWLTLALLYFAACIFVFGELFQWVFKPTGT